MPASDLLDILLSHDRWATQQILEACAPLSEEQFHHRFEIGPGSDSPAIQTKPISDLGGREGNL
jgi:uncharacterized damage-inducible protein DinB